jgi:HAAS domain-containing protein
MDLLERYLASVRILLPTSKRDDIIAELRGALTERREERSSELGRTLTAEEDEQMLRGFGHPVVVAARYRQPQYLIGPDLFPLFSFVLRLVLVVVVAATLLTGIMSAIASSLAVGPAVAKAVITAWNSALVAIGVVTLVFAGLQRHPPRAGLLTDWRVRDLPEFKKPRQPGWVHHVAGIVANVIFILWWLRVMPLSPAVPVESGHVLHIGLAPVWQTLYLPVLVLSLLAIAVHAVRLRRERGERLAACLDLVLQVGLLAITGGALRAGHQAVVVSAGLPAQTVAAVEHGLNVALQISLVVVLCVALFRVGYDLWILVVRRSVAS